MPLEGIKVLDLSRLLPGAYCTQLLCAFGAEVWKLEPPEGDPARRWGPRVGGLPAYFYGLNRGKKSLVLDLKREGAKEVMGRLLRRVDVLLEGFRPGVAERLGVGYEEASRINPRLIYCSLSGYGQDGPLRERSGHDINYIALGGLLGLTGEGGGRPVIPGGQIADITGGLGAAVGILLALRRRERTGEGEYIDVAMLDGVLSWLPLYLGEYEAGVLPERGRMILNGGYACYNVYETRDGGYVALGALEPHFWERFCRATGKDEMIPFQYDPSKQGELIEELRRVFMERGRDEWAEFLTSRDVPCEPVLSFEEVLSHPQVLARRMIREGEMEGARKVRWIKAPIRFSSIEERDHTSPPSLGEHTEEILREVGFDSEEIRRLREEGVLGGRR